MGDRSLSIRLGTEGKAQVKADLGEIGDSGDASAKRLSKAYERAGDDIDAAMRRQAAAAAKLSAITPQTAMQMQVNGAAGSSLGLGGAYAASGAERMGQFEGSARKSAAAFRELLALEEKAQSDAAALKVKLDPLSAAQGKYADEIKRTAELRAKGLLTEAEEAGANALSAAALAAARRELGEHSAAMGLNRTQTMIAQSAGMRFTDMLIAGQSPIRAFALESHKLGEVLAFDDGGVAGGLAKVRALITPTTVSIAAGAVLVAAGAAAWYSYTTAIDHFQSLAQGAGRVLGENGAQLEANAIAAAKAGDITLAAAREIQTGYLDVAKSGTVLVGLTALTKDFAAATGVDAKTAQQQLAAAFADPIAGADTMASKYGVLTQAQAEHIAKLIEEGKDTEAQTELLADLGRGFAGAADHTNLLVHGWNNVKNAASEAWEWMGKAIDRAVSGGAAMDRIKALQDERDRGPSVGQMLTGATYESFRQDKQRQIDEIRYQSRQDAARQRMAADASAQQRGQSVVDDYTGASKLSDYQKKAGLIRGQLRTNMDPEARQQATSALAAYTHAIDTFIPAQEKATKLAEIDARIAETKKPAEKAALAAQRERIAVSGEVITTADAEARAHAKADAAAAHATRTNGGHAASLARQAESMEVAARASIVLASAYLTSSTAGFEADARRKAETDATRKGVSVEEQTRRQINLTVSEAIASGAKSVAQLRDETAARGEVNAAVAAGTIDVAQMGTALSDEAALRPLLKLQTLAQGDALRVLTTAIGEYRKALAAAHVEEARNAALTGTDAARSRAAEIRASILDLGKSPDQQAINAARRAAVRQADDAKMTDAPGKPDRTNFINAKVDEAAAGNEASRKKFIADTLKGQGDSIVLATRENALLAANDNYRRLELAKLAAILDLKRRGVDPESADGQAILGNIVKLDKIAVATDKAKAAIGELRNFGSSALEKLFSGSAAGSWGDRVRSVIDDVKNELLKLAVINPLKNLLNGNSNEATIGSVIKNISSLFAKPGHNAGGTENWSGGATWLAENGPEIVNLPAGSKVTPAGQTRRLLAGNDNQGGGAVSVHVSSSPYFDVQVQRIAAPMAQMAAVGGSQMAQDSLAERQLQQIPA